MNIKVCTVAAVLSTGLFSLTACSKKSENPQAPPKDPNTAEVVSIDRFSAAAAHLQVRTAANGLPGANQAVDFDKVPFSTRGFTPAGKITDYYNFDVQPTAPAPIWAFFKKDGSAVTGQLNVIDVIPGDAGYNDFWQVYKVTVPDNYVANTTASYSEIAANGYTIEKTNMIVNCPVVPKGSTAVKRLTSEDPGLTKGWYKGKLVFYFTFSEKALATTGAGAVPVSPIYVTFNINPGQTGGGPDSGFKAETGTSPMQTHNVVSTIPSDAGYSPLWAVSVYDNANFGSVNNLSSASSATILARNVANVNCPVVYIKP